jgi:uncharacterized lipoprotein YmbA
MKKRKRNALAFGLIVLLGMPGCRLLSPVADVTRYYILDTTEHTPFLTEAQEQELVLGIGRVRLARYLEAPGIAVRERGHAIAYSGRHRWAEPLDVSVGRILAENLVREESVSQVVSYPQQRRVLPDLDLDLHISRAEGVRPLEGEPHAVFRATWEIRAGRRAELIASGTVQQDRLPWNGSDYDQLAASLSVALAELTGQIAAAVAEEAARR